MGEMSIGRAITWLADQRSETVAVRYDGTVLTRRELDLATNRIARRWMVGGMEVDDLVALSLSDPVDLVLATVATWKAGATPMPLPPELDPDERGDLLSRAGPGWLVDHPVVVDDADSADPLPELAASCWKSTPTRGSDGQAHIIRSAEPARFDPIGAVAAHLPREAVQVVAGPLCDAAPFHYAMRGLMTGHELVLLTRPDAGEWLRLVATEKATWGTLGPALRQQISRVPDRASYDVSSLRSVLHVGTPGPAWVTRDWQDWLGHDRVVESDETGDGRRATRWATPRAVVALRATRRQGDVIRHQRGVNLTLT